MLACDSATEMSVVEQRHLVVVDSIGSLYGNDYEMFGNINGAYFVDDSTFVVLDKGYNELRVFDRECNFIKTVNCQGNGPWECQDAAYLSSLDNTIAVFEFLMPPRAVFFDSAVNPKRSVVLSGYTALMEPSLVDSLTIIGSVGSFSEQNGNQFAGIDVCSWSTITGEKLCEYFSNSIQIDSREGLYSRLVSLELTIAASSSGYVYVAPSKNDYKILIYSSEGMLIDSIYQTHERAMRSQEEILAEWEWRKLRDIHLGDWIPSEYELEVTQLQVQDSLKYLWVSHGSYFNPSFDVFNLLGDLEFTCTVEGLPENEIIRFGINDNGILAYTDYCATYPRLYILEFR